MKVSKGFCAVLVSGLALGFGAAHTAASWQSTPTCSSPEAVTVANRLLNDDGGTGATNLFKVLQISMEISLQENTIRTVDSRKGGYECRAQTSVKVKGADEFTAKLKGAKVDPNDKSVSNSITSAAQSTVGYTVELTDKGDDFVVTIVK